MAKRPASPALLAHLARIRQRLRSDPELAARRAAGVRRALADPAKEARRLAGIRAKWADQKVYTLLHVASGRRVSGKRAELVTATGITLAQVVGLVTRAAQQTRNGWRLVPHEATRAAPERESSKGAVLLGPATPPKPARKLRRCLGGCDKTFWSEGPHNRVCGHCARAPARSSAGSFRLRTTR